MGMTIQSRVFFRIKEALSVSYYVIAILKLAIEWIEQVSKKNGLGVCDAGSCSKVNQNLCCGGLQNTTLLRWSLARVKRKAGC